MDLFPNVKTEQLDTEATENKHHGEIIGNDPSLANGSQFKLTFGIDRIEQTPTSALMQAAVRSFKNTVQKKKS